MTDHRTKPRVYVAGPYTADPVAGVRAAVHAMGDIERRGGHPVVPHLTLLADLVLQRPYTEWLALDIEELRSCDIVYRLPGSSPGAAVETRTAYDLGIPVANNLQELEGAIARAVHAVELDAIHATRRDVLSARERMRQIITDNNNTTEEE